MGGLWCALNRRTLLRKIDSAMLDRQTAGMFWRASAFAYVVAGYRGARS